jgi:hypothetical protein
MSGRIPLLFAPGIRDGYHESRGNYGTVLSVLGRAGFDAYFFQPDWNDPRPQTWAAEMADSAKQVAKNHAVAQVALGGFSCGGLTAVLAASRVESESSEIKVAGLLACSMSPWFGLDRVRRAYQQPTSDLHGSAETLNANLCELELPMLSCPVQLYVGIQEIRTVHDIHQDALKAWPQAVSIRPPTRHNIFDGSYLQAIEKNAPLLATG